MPTNQAFVPGVPRVIRADDLNRIQLAGYQPDFRLRAQPAVPPLEARVLFDVQEVSRPFLDPPHQQSMRGGDKDDPPPPPPGSHILTSLHGARVNFVFGLSGHEASNRVLIGGWSGTPQPSNAALLLRSYMTIYAPLRTVRVFNLPGEDQYQQFGIALGLPAGLEAGANGANAADLLIRAMAGQTWGVRIMAIPVDEAFVLDLRTSILDELRRVEAAATSAGVSNRLAQLYVANLEKHLVSLNAGLSLGLWRVATYLTATQSSYNQLAALWRALFSGPSTDHSPLRVLQSDLLRPWVSNWVVPDDPSDNLVHPFAFQTLLNSAQLATIASLPTHETSGFARKRSARFDVSTDRRKNVENSALHLGAVEDSGMEQGDYAIKAEGLRRHAFVTGVTGSGKTNTVFQLLRQIDAKGVPFLILEPAKSEYRALAAEPALKDRLRVYTIGDERVAPLRLNPFEVVGWPAIPVSVHLDLLRSCFAASFGMWSPLPQILEQSLYAIYKDRGWDIVNNMNARLAEGGDPSPAFPTMTDLAAKAEVYIASLGYADEVRSNLRAALLTRLEALRIGGKGAMFDTARSTPMADLLSRPVVLELQNLGDDDDKAFFMALFFARLVEYRRSVGPEPDALKHVLVIEEAHRLLTNVGRAASSQPEQADPKGKAVESFSNLISEIRAYGQGLIVADQVPTKLAPDVVKNTNLKVIHRIVAEDDRSVIAGATAMNDEQKLSLATLAIGKAAVFEDGQDSPLLLVIPRAKDLPDALAVTDDQLRMPRPSISPAYETCAGQCSAASAECNAAREAAGDPLLQQTFAKLTLSLFGAPGAFQRLYPDLEAVIGMRAAGRSANRDCLLTHLSYSLAERWGKRLQWTFSATAQFAAALRAVLNGDAASLQQFWTSCGPMLTANFSPCLACGVSAKEFNDPSRCSVRVAVEDMVEAGTFDKQFTAASRADDSASDDRLRNSYAVCNDAAFELIEFPSNEAEVDNASIALRAQRSILCFAQHMLERHYQRAPWVMQSQLMRIVGNGSAPAEETGAKS